jgi:two-component system, chemotaxis family, CheB/CheR fusion protein
MTNGPERDPAFEELLGFIRDERGFDFTGYKRASLSRRISKRMQDAKTETFEDYRKHLDDDPQEFARLFDTILINVTSFFRDPQAWEFVRSDVVPGILAQRKDSDPIRVWSTGCSTGEEAYTIAMIFAEVMGDEEFMSRVKIYATDVDDSALTLGRHATYSEAQVEPVPEELRDRYFEIVNGSFAFRPDVRRSVIFGRHDLVQDPPISRIDFLVSRNTLMYFDVPAQERILSNFHFALRDQGYLFLGKSEVLVARSPLFAAVDLRRRIFAKVPTVIARDRAVPRPVRGDDSPTPADSAAIRDAGFESAPLAQVIVDRAGRLAGANMQARMQFGLAQRDVGSLLQDLELSYRPIELRSRIEQAYGERHSVNVRDVEWHTGADVRYLDVSVQPLTSRTGELLGITVTFADVTRYRRLQEALQESKGEVETAYEELQATVEELETTNEELQSTNEELETTNEELQSTNEELETMNEELQSTNEELETINDELHQRTDELNDVNAFLEAVLGSLSAAVIVVDTELRVQAWNDAARELWGLHSDEVQGQHLLNLDIGLPVDRLRVPARAGLAGETPEPELIDAINRRGRPVQVRVRFAPLATDGQAVRGAIVMMELAADT